jgi:ribosomal protein S18 acetylase RimI-like enzyme
MYKSTAGRCPRSPRDVSAPALMPVDPEPVVIRPPRDGDSVGRFLAGLSMASRYDRFFFDVRHVSPELLATMATVAPGRLVLLAVDGDTVAGHAVATDLGGDTADIGVVVADAYQHRGIGRRLVRELAAGLAAHGLVRVCCDVLSGNDLVLAWLRRLLSDHHVERHGATTTVHGTFAA